MTAKRHGWAAALLSLLTPGLGHLYAGRVRSAFVLGILVTPFAALLFLLDVLAAPPAALFFLFGVAIVLTVVVGIPIHAALVARRTASAYQLQPFNRSYVYLLGGHFKTGHRSTPQIRPPRAYDRDRCKIYRAPAPGRKSAWTLVRQLRGPHLRTWAWCSSRSRSAVTAAVSPSSLPQSSTGRFDVRIVDARS